MRLFYSFGIQIYGGLIRLSSLWSDKSKKWIKGRRSWASFLEKANLTDCIWVHCASLGEFEQGRPLIEKLREHYPDQKILLTFFSPSGYEVRKNYEVVDAVAYLPLDTQKNARKFIGIVKPRLAVFVKYEVWHNYYRELAKKEIPHFIISMILRPGQVYFKPWGAWFLNTLKRVNKLFTQNEESLALLRKKGIQNGVLAGDTRFDRVEKVVSSVSELPLISGFVGERRCLVAGSTWEEDEKILRDFPDRFPEWKLILAPHELNPIHLEKIKARFPEAILWSQLGREEDERSAILIIDTIGILSAVYQYADIAYIGGGFGKGIHNTLEAAAYGIPVLFGPNFQKFREARELVDIEAAFEIDSGMAVITRISEMEESPELYQKACNASKDYVEENLGATRIILDELIPILEGEHL